MFFPLGTQLVEDFAMYVFRSFNVLCVFCFFGATMSHGMRSQLPQQTRDGTHALAVEM